MGNSFTSTFHSIVGEIITNAWVSAPIAETKVYPNDPRLHNIRALWDTGATNSVITKRTATILGLKPIDSARVFHAGGESKQPVYLVSVYLPNNVAVPNIRVTECPDITGNFGLIIGMNIISRGDFAFTNVGKNSVFSFRMPSEETVDYVSHRRGIAEKPYLAPRKQNRNDPCYCGSGKKYKDCHGKNK
jgi:uncharacterized protein YchJ